MLLFAAKGCQHLRPHFRGLPAISPRLRLFSLFSFTFCICCSSWIIFLAVTHRNTEIVRSTKTWEGMGFEIRCVACQEFFLGEVQCSTVVLRTQTPFRYTIRPELITRTAASMQTFFFFFFAQHIFAPQHGNATNLCVVMCRTSR